MNSNFNFIRRGASEPISLTYGAAAKRGIAVGHHATDVRAAILATSANFAGFLSQEVSATGPGLREAVLDVGNGDTGLENAAKAGSPIGVIDAEIVEFEGTDYHESAGGGTIDATTVVGANLSFAAGKFKLAETGETVFYKVTGNSGLSGSTLVAQNGGVRFRVKKAAPVLAA